MTHALLVLAVIVVLAAVAVGFVYLIVRATRNRR